MNLAQSPWGLESGRKAEGWRWRQKLDDFGPGRPGFILP